MTIRLPNRKARRGFTLTEMLVVVAIIVVLAAIAVPITLNVLNEQKREIARAQMNSSIKTAVIDIVRKTGEFPTSSEQLLGPPNGQGMLTSQSYLDPWNNPFEIQWIQQDVDNPMFKVVSYGSNPNDPSGVIEVSSH